MNHKVIIHCIVAIDITIVSLAETDVSQYCELSTTMYDL